MSDTSGGDCSLNNHTISQHYCDFNNIDACSGYGFKTATLSPNSNIQVLLRIFMIMFKMVMVI